MSKLTFKPSYMGTIRGARYCYEVTKEVNNIPGFAPETYICDVCDVVVKFLQDEEPYIQFSDGCPNVITIAELEEIIECAKRGFVKEDFEEVKG